MVYNCSFIGDPFWLRHALNGAAGTTVIVQYFLHKCYIFVTDSQLKLIILRLQNGVERDMIELRSQKRQSSFYDRFQTLFSKLNRKMKDVMILDI